MQIVIDIDDGLARYIRNDNSVPKKSDYELLVNAIYRGTPLPKGHGDLIDRGDLPVDFFINDEGNRECVVTYDDLENAPTIIEADREVET